MLARPAPEPPCPMPARIAARLAVFTPARFAGNVATAGAAVGAAAGAIAGAAPGEADAPANDKGNLRNTGNLKKWSRGTLETPATLKIGRLPRQGKKTRLPTTR